MNNRILLFLGAVLAFVPACQKETDPDPGTPTTFRVNIYNSFNLLEAEYAVFLTDASGTVRAFRWLPGEDTARVSIPNVQATDRFDCTVVEIKMLQAPGTGVTDTTVRLTTYTNLYNGAAIHLRDPNYLQRTDLIVDFTGFNSLDSIVVPQGLTFVQPDATNNFRGQYRVLHTGKIWLRLRMNGENKWRYALYDNVTGDTYTTNLDAQTLPQIDAKSATVSLPFLTNWDIALDRVLDLDQHKLLPIGSMLPIPGGPVPIFNRVDVFEPAGQPFNGYRLRLMGFDPAPGGLGYVCDRYVQNLPLEVTPPGFSILSASVADNREVAIQCNGMIDLFAFTRRYNSGPNISWEALVAPTNTGAVQYRLPDVPADLSARFPALKSYDFGNSVEVRAEGYAKLNVYPEVIARRMLQDDPLWQMKSGYEAVIRVF